MSQKIIYRALFIALACSQAGTICTESKAAQMLKGAKEIVNSEGFKSLTENGKKGISALVQVAKAGGNFVVKYGKTALEVTHTGLSTIKLYRETFGSSEEPECEHVHHQHKN